MQRRKFLHHGFLRRYDKSYTVSSLLNSIPFRDHSTAESNFRSVVEYLSEQVVVTLLVLLRQSPDPDLSLIHLERFLKSASMKGEPFRAHGNRLPILITVFGNSSFLAETLIRYPESLHWALDERRLYRVLSTEEFCSELGLFPLDTTDNETAHILAKFKRKHLLRIAIRDLLQFSSLAEVTEELSNLADAILQGGQEHIQRQLITKLEGVSGRKWPSSARSRFMVVALGKLGGRELNYSSDIDLMYLYDTGEKAIDSPKVPGQKFFIQLAQRLTRMLSQITPDGSCFRVDLRLRPEGESGELALPIKGALKYYSTRARDWELQMLIKARIVAGNRTLGEKFLTLVEPLIYQTTTDFSTIERVAETRDRIQQNLTRHQLTGINVKLERGGIRDIEFLVQCLQRLYGGLEAWVRNRGTLLGLHRLHDKGYLSPQDYSHLHTAYSYLRTLEHRLQIEHNRQVHTLPTHTTSQLIFSQRIYGTSSVPQNNLTMEVNSHLRRVGEIYQRVIGGQRPSYTAEHLTSSTEVDDLASKHLINPSWTAQIQHLEQQSPHLAKAVSDLQIHWGHKHFKYFLNNLVSSPTMIEIFEENPDYMSCIGDLIEHSPYLAEQIIRHPQDCVELWPLVELQRARVTDVEHHDPSPVKHTREWITSLPKELASKDMPLNNSSALLRRFYRQRMLALLAKSIYLREPIFSTLNATSRLAEFVVQQALQMASVQTEQTLGRARPSPPLQVVALGRLGMREFDLGSDADLVFVLPDEGSAHIRWWNHAIEILVDIMNSRTGDGMLFTVDNRLRPMGRDGELIQTESRFKKYFSEQAEHWEAITYMKARTIAGDLKQGAKFLSELQDVGWQRYGLSGELASKLVAMRNRIEETHGIANPIKAGRGGYYDVDFILMYLRLKNAELFFPSLNTPERIEVLKNTKALDTDQANTLEMAAEFLSSLDHAVRVSIGPSATKIPISVSQRNVISNLVQRWSRVEISSTSIWDSFAMVCKETRGVFEDVFRSQ